MKCLLQTARRWLHPAPPLYVSPVPARTPPYYPCRDLLAAYVDTASDDAFARLVARHVDVVYCAALRRHVAEEVTQSGGGDGNPPGCPKHKHALVLEIARRDGTAVNGIRDDDPAEWDQVAPHLDGALASLYPIEWIAG
jgi:hypothetical protein